MVCVVEEVSGFKASRPAAMKHSSLFVVSSVPNSDFASCNLNIDFSFYLIKQNQRFKF